MSLLGLASQIKKLSSDLDVYDLLQRGLPGTVYRSLLKNTGLNTTELSVGLPFKLGLP